MPSILFIVAYCLLLLEEGVAHIGILSFPVCAVLGRVSISRTGEKHLRKQPQLSGEKGMNGICIQNSLEGKGKELT